MSADRESAAAAAELHTIIADGPEVHFQPVVDLERRTTVGFEALCRVPADSRLGEPLELFATARAHGRLHDLDWACRAAAVESALQSELRPPLKLFLNVEPAALHAGPPAVLADLAETATRDLDLVVEFTERAIAQAPASLLRGVDRARGIGAAVALDDIGSDPRLLALLPLVRPDVVKLDIDVIHAPASRQSAETASQVGAYAEATGAVVIAEGIEREEQIVAAQALGASLGQGWLFGRAGPLPEVMPSSPIQVAIGRAPPLAPASSPTAIVGRRMPLRRGSLTFVRELALQLAAQAYELGEHAVVAASIGAAPTAGIEFERLAERAALVAVIGADAELPGIHTGAISGDDPLAREWNLTVLGPYFTGALVARTLDDGVGETCDFALTHAPELVVEVADLLLTRAVT